MDFFLKRLVLDSACAVQISEEEFKQIKLAKNALIECLFIEEKYDILVESYCEFEISLMESSIRSVILNRRNTRDFGIDRGLFNRRTMNVLTTARTYVDSVKHHVNNILKLEESAVTLDLDRAFTHEYDTRLGYRAMEKLRNYVQHRGFPIEGVSYHQGWVGEKREERRIQFSVSPYLQPEDLKLDKKFNRTVLNELQALGEKIDLRALAREYMEGIWSVHSALRKDFSKRIGDWEGVLENASSHFQSGCPNEELGVSLAAIATGNEEKNPESIQIVGTFVDYRKHLEEKNRSLQNLSRRYVTNKTIV